MALEISKVNLFDETNLFKISPEDDQILIFAGNRQLPEDAPTSGTTENYFRDDFEGSALDETNRWTKVVTGTGAVSVAGGICTLETGTTAGSTAKITLKITKSFVDYIRLKVSFRAKFTTRSTNGYMFIGLWKAVDSYEEFSNEPGTSNCYAVAENPADGGYGNAFISQVTDWHSYTIDRYTTGNMSFNITDASEIYTEALPNAEDNLYVRIFLSNSTNAVNNILEIDWIEIEGLNI